MRTLFARLAVSGLVAAVVIVAMSYLNNSRTLTPHNGQVHFERSEIRDLRIIVTNPRRVGRHYFTSSRGNTRSSDWSPSTPTEEYEYTVDVLPCCVVSGDPSVLQMIHDKRGGGLSGFMGAYETYWVDFYPLDRIVRGGAEKLLVPLHRDIAKYVFLLKALDEKTDWRVFEVAPDTILQAINSGLIVPDLMTLPKVDDHAQRTALAQIINKSCP